MATIFKPVIPRGLPTNAELFVKNGEQFAKWKNSKGKTITAKVKTREDGTQRVMVPSATYVARYRDGEGIVRKVTTGCRDEGAARSVLNELVSRSEKVKSGIISPEEDRIADHQSAKIADTLPSYLTHLRARGVTGRHVLDAERLVSTVFRECRFTALRDVRTEAVEAWLVREY